MPKNEWEYRAVERAYEASYFEQRFRNRIYEAVIKAVEESAVANKWKRKELATRSGKKASQISKWLSGPSNWTLDTVSNLLYAIDAELDFVVTPFVRKNKSNEFHSLNNPHLTGTLPQSPVAQLVPVQITSKSQFPVFRGTS
jgi:transcriptional regulator with XRE-family HTH domain